MTESPLQRVIDHPFAVPALIVAVSLGALAAALASQHWGGLQPCVLCFYQRYAYLVATAFGLLGSDPNQCRPELVRRAEAAGADGELIIRKPISSA